MLRGLWCAQVMPGEIELNLPQSVEDFIDDLLDELEAQLQYDIYSLTLPPSFRLQFTPASAVYRDNGSPAVVDLSGNDSP